ncbi:MAG: hypothetical protein ACJ8GW_16250 [Massilia sp.]
MNKWLFLCLMCAISASASACNTSSAEELRNFWQQFRAASLREAPARISKFYAFPLQVLGPYGDEKPIPVSRKAFLKKYALIFRTNIDNEGKAELLDSLEKFNDASSERELAQALRNKPCLEAPFTARIASYHMTWSKGSGWAIDKVYYVDNFRALAREMKQPANKAVSTTR